ncbi:MAG: hypothetical protein ABII00_04460 [Elusimicrobiota bacterium]
MSNANGTRTGSEQRVLHFHYRFAFRDGKVKEFDVRLDAETLSLVGDRMDAPPPWTRLSFRRCPNCPLEASAHPHCPAAVSLVDIVELFKDVCSSETVDVEIKTDSRTCAKRTPLSGGASGIIGLHMATSGCPHLEKLKPMVRTHLPFATLQESLYRMMAMYMMAQHFQAKRGGTPDWKMDGLVRMLEDLRMVNRSFCGRLYDVCGGDANLNALVHLDCFADNAVLLLRNRKGVDDFERAFTAHFED